MPNRLPSARWILLICTAFASAVQAVTISPVLVELSASQRVASVTLSNPSDQAISFQAETLTWNQLDGTDHYEPTEELMVTPPIAEIPPQSSQIFRVTLRRPLADNTEKAYRLILEDVSEELSTQPGVIAIRFKHNLPVFVAPAGEMKDSLRWSQCAAAMGKGCVHLDNEGNRRIRILELTVAGKGGQQTVQGGTVLAGAWKQWHFDLLSGQGQPITIIAKTDQGELSADLSMPMP